MEMDRHPGNPDRNSFNEILMMKENETYFSHKYPSICGNWKQEPVVIFASFQPPFPLCCNYNESHDAMKINEPVGASLSNNLKSWNNEISTKSRYTFQIQEQTKPKQNKANVFEE